MIGPSKLPPRVVRHVHDLNASLRRRLGGPPRMAEMDAAERIAVVQAAGSVERQLNLEAAMGCPGEGRIGYRVEERALLRVRNADLVGYDGHVYLPSGALLPISSRPLGKPRRPVAWLRQRIRGRAFSLIGRSMHNRAHFSMEHGPRLLAALPFLPADTVVLVPHHARFAGDYLALLGIPEGRIRVVVPGTLRVEELFVLDSLCGELSRPPTQEFTAPEHLQTLIAQLQSNAPDSPEGAAIFLSRADAPTRQLQNEAELIEVLAAMGGPIERLRLSECALPAQIRRIQAAPLVIGAQGQGMHLLPFARNALHLILDLEPAPQGIDWTAAFAVYSELAGNRALRWRVKAAQGEADGAWAYPAARLAADLNRLAAIVAQGAQSDAALRPAARWFAAGPKPN